MAEIDMVGIGSGCRKGLQSIGRKQIELVFLRMNRLLVDANDAFAFQNQTDAGKGWNGILALPVFITVQQACTFQTDGGFPKLVLNNKVVFIYKKTPFEIN